MRNIAFALAFLACDGHGRRARNAPDSLQSADSVLVAARRRAVRFSTVQHAACRKTLHEVNQSRPVKALSTIFLGFYPTPSILGRVRRCKQCPMLLGRVLDSERSSRCSQLAKVTGEAPSRAFRNTSLAEVRVTRDKVKTQRNSIRNHCLHLPGRHPVRTSSTFKATELARIRTSLLRFPILLASTAFFLMRQPALASGGLPVSVPSTPLSHSALVARSVLWACLFFTSSLFAGAETAITTLWPWKVKQLAAEDGEKSPFRSLESDITTVLRTVLIGVTFCTIYSTALVTDVAVGLFGSRGVTYATIASTFVTLFFGEILPKSLAVAQPEKVARFALPIINGLSYLLFPLSWLTATGTDLLLGLLGVDKEKSAETVTKPELRMVVNQAAEVGSVDLYEEDMIEGVLDLQRTQVSQVMTPRVDIEAVEQNTTLSELLSVAMQTRYSRIPVYSEDIDNVVGIVLTRELLGFCNLGEDCEKPADDIHKSYDLTAEQLRKTNVAELMENVEGQFVPESMRAMNALKLMRQSRVHMLFVVDEYGGTSGIITLEDILETLVGEIYDEDDSEEQIDDASTIVQADDGSFTMDGMTDIDVVLKRLELQDAIPSKVLDDYATLSGFLCHEAGQILAVGDVLLLAQWRFEVLEADERKLVSLRATNMSSIDGVELSDVETRRDTVEWRGLPAQT